MAKLIKHLLLFGILLLLVFEVFLRLTGLASEVMDLKLNEAGMVVYQPYSEGYRTRGMRAEVNAHFHINGQGWNSSFDFDQIDSSTIAIIGDSFIAGFWNDVDSTVAACLQHMIRTSGEEVQVHNYGHAGSNFIDFENLANHLLTQGYQHIYIYLGKKDFQPKKPSYTNQKRLVKRTGIRYWYPKFAVTRYLNVNAGIGEYFRPQKQKVNEKKEKALQQSAVQRIDALAKDPAIVFFFDDVFFDEIQPKKMLLKIAHKRKPIDHGFNRHWNVNGNKNAAETIYDHWTKKRNTFE